MDYGFPITTEPSILFDLVKPPVSLFKEQPVIKVEPHGKHAMEYY